MFSLLQSCLGAATCNIRAYESSCSFRRSCRGQSYTLALLATGIPPWLSRCEPPSPNNTSEHNVLKEQHNVSNGKTNRKIKHICVTINKVHEQDPILEKVVAQEGGERSPWVVTIRLHPQNYWRRSRQLENGCKQGLKPVDIREKLLRTGVRE